MNRDWCFEFFFYFNADVKCLRADTLNIKTMKVWFVKIIRSQIYASHNTIKASFSYTEIPVWNYVLQTKNMN